MSKLGLHLSAGGHSTKYKGESFGLGDMLRQCAESGNPVPVIFSLDQNIWPDIVRYSPKTVLIYRTQPRVYLGRRGEDGMDGPPDMYRGDPIAVARNWMDAILPNWAKNPAHYYAPLNEQDPATKEAFAWLNTFTLECLSIAEARGIKLALYAFSAGNPKDLLDETGKVKTTSTECWNELLPSLAAGKSGGHILLLHEYGLDYGTLRASTPHLALRYRSVYAKLPPEARMPLVISEASAGNGYRGNEKGWLEDAKWYDSELMKDRAVIGCCLYQLGGVENLANILPQLSEYIAATPTPVISVENPQTGPRYRVVCDNLSVRIGPSFSAQNVGSLKKGEEFVVTETNSSSAFLWGKMDKGWVALQQIIAPLTERVS